jgi:4-amino-4-deoxychorismate lyase
MAESPATLIDGIAAERLPADDRGLAYGDGVFETVLVHDGRPVWWQAHLDRLEQGARVLGIAMPAAAAWRADCDALCAGTSGRQVLKLLLTRGSSRRGYAVDPQGVPRRIAQCLPAPPLAAADGIGVRWCDLRLAAQPRLAGLKHLNRLEQVLARAEWSDPAIAEGLLCDADGALVSAIAGNLFVVRHGVAFTPPVDRCGVAGICRQYLLGCGAQVRSLRRDELLAADELFVCNSVRGILPVTRLGDRRWPIGALTRGLVARLARAEPAFAVEW